MSKVVPEMCKWNAFTIDSKGDVCKDEASNHGKDFPIARDLDGGA